MVEQFSLLSVKKLRKDKTGCNLIRKYANFKARFLGNQLTYFDEIFKQCLLDYAYGRKILSATKTSILENGNLSIFLNFLEEAATNDLIFRLYDEEMFIKIVCVLKKLMEKLDFSKS